MPTLEKTMEMEMAEKQVEIRAFRAEDAAAFRSLNEAWIETYFGLEEHDREMLGDPETYILRPGGHIVMAFIEERAVGCCALIPMRPGVYEVAKMAVSEESRGRGIGRKVLKATVAQARAMGATLLTLETNSTLRNAIHLYESVGFRHLPPGVSPYTRADVFMEMPL
ncbi:GNAT family N-acetyltransferase [Granulicella sp. dw_53]|uniref:GNAT family N-acetyltransferase n=1 Tax=Granulicella sp. dw_53 TaxID=2719792 RepID=UPI0021050DC4|nr:GNAT family N-acetyltransferase [Granulicella sp. dw_53]